MPLPAFDGGATSTGRWTGAWCRRRGGGRRRRVGVRAVRVRAGTTRGARAGPRLQPGPGPVRQRHRPWRCIGWAAAWAVASAAAAAAAAASSAAMRCLALAFELLLHQFVLDPVLLDLGEVGRLRPRPASSIRRNGPAPRPHPHVAARGLRGLRRVRRPPRRSRRVRPRRCRTRHRRTHRRRVRRSSHRGRSGGGTSRNRRRRSCRRAPSCSPDRISAASASMTASSASASLMSTVRVSNSDSASNIACAAALARSRAAWISRAAFSAGVSLCWASTWAGANTDASTTAHETTTTPGAAAASGRDGRGKRPRAKGPLASGIAQRYSLMANTQTAP